MLANTSATHINKLVIQALVDNIGDRELNTTLWSQIANTLSKPPLEDPVNAHDCDLCPEYAVCEVANPSFVHKEN